MKATKKIHVGFVITGGGDDYWILLQLPSDNHSGFVLADDDQTWQPAFAPCVDWEPIADDDERITPEDHERLDWILEQARAGL